MISYKNPGDSLTASEWNDLFSYADGLLTDYLGGLSNLLLNYYTGLGYNLYQPYSPKVFFFFSPVSTPANQLHPLAPAALSILNNLYETNVIPYFRKYDHAAIVNQVNSWPIDTVQTPNPAQSDNFQVVRLVPEAFPYTNWKAAVFPEGDGSAPFLDLCLSVLTRSVNGTDYAVTILSNGKVEKVSDWDMVEVIVNSDTSLDPSWNKYNAFRVHNFGIATASVDLGGYSVSIPSGQCRCVRRQLVGVLGLGGATNVYNWTAGYNYYQKMIPGDAKFFNFQLFHSDINANFSSEGTKIFDSVLSPSNSMALPLALLGGSLDFSQFWDMSSLYCPTYFPSPTSSTRIFDLLTHKGDFKIQTLYPAPNGTHTVQFTGFDNLSAMFSSADSRLSFTFNPTTYIGTINGSVWLQLTDIGTNLLFSLTSQKTTPVHSGQLNWGSFSVTNPFDLSAVLGFSRPRKLTTSTTDTDYHYYAYSVDGNGNYILGAQQTVTVQNTSEIVDSTDTNNEMNYHVTDTLQTLATCLSGLQCPLISASGASFVLTTFGVVMLWSETYQITSSFSIADVDGTGNFLGCAISGNTMVIKRGVLIGSGFAANQFPASPLVTDAFGATTNPLATWHFPRQARVYQPRRLVNTIADSEPWNGTTGATAYYALQSETILSS